MWERGEEVWNLESGNRGPKIWNQGIEAHKNWNQGIEAQKIWDMAIPDSLPALKYIQDAYRVVINSPE